MPCWIAWKTEARVPGGKPAKVPYAANDHRAASDKPRHWTDRQTAEAYANTSGAAGIGLMFFALSDDTALCGLDLDTCISPDGAVASWAADIVRLLDSYTEVSPSGTGLKTFFRVAYADHLDLMNHLKAFGAKWPQGETQDAGQGHPPAVELYLAKRFFAVTGRRIEGGSDEIRALPTTALMALLDRLGPRPAPIVSQHDLASDIEPIEDEQSLNERLKAACEADKRLHRMMVENSFSNPTDRSACAMALGGCLRDRGFSYSEMTHVLSKHPATAAWTAEKGVANDCRELERIWGRATHTDAWTPAQIEFPAEALPSVAPGNDNAPSVVQKPERIKSGCLTVLSPDDCETATPRPYVVKGLVGRGDVAVLTAAPGTGKSAWGPRLGYAVAQGVERFHGMRVRKGPVLYLGSEDGDGLRVRVRALRREFGPASDFHLIPHPVDLMTPTTVSGGYFDGATQNDALLDLANLIDRIQPALIIIDTLARSFPGLNENDNSGEGMGRVRDVLRKLASIANSAVLVLHHPPHGEQRARGGTVLPADADVDMIMVRNMESGIRTIRFNKNRNGADEKVLVLTIEIRQLGEDEDGDPITAVIALEADPSNSPRDGSKSSGPKMNGNQSIALAAVRDLIERDGADLPDGDGYPAYVQGVEFKKWEKEFIDRFPENGTLLSSKLKAGKRALAYLAQGGLIKMKGNWIWLLDQPGMEFEFEKTGDFDDDTARSGSSVGQSVT